MGSDLTIWRRRKGVFDISKTNIFVLASAFLDCGSQKHKKYCEAMWYNYHEEIPMFFKLMVMRESRKQKKCISWIACASKYDVHTWNSIQSHWEGWKLCFLWFPMFHGFQLCILEEAFQLELHSWTGASISPIKCGQWVMGKLESNNKKKEEQKISTSDLKPKRCPISTLSWS